MCHKKGTHFKEFTNCINIQDVNIKFTREEEEDGQPEEEELPDVTLELASRWLNFCSIPRNGERARMVHKVEKNGG